jgi:two-component system response regulator AtoC
MTNPRITGRARILVIDDDEVVRLSYAMSLAADYEMQTASDGRQALSLMQRLPADVVLLDQRMPGMHGLEVLKAIKSRWPESEVVMITGYPSVESAKEAVRLGACDYLSKPVGPDEVLGAARNALLHKQWTLREQLPTKETVQ